MRFSFSSAAIALSIALQLGQSASAESPETTSDLAHIDAKTEKPVPWPDGIIPFDISKLDADQAKQANEAFLAVNPILDYTTTKGKVKDIKIENFDISFSGKRILTNASLTLGYGRRYGLVGRNGVGKSTLLRAMSRREINVPAHISILHVEQEVRNLINHMVIAVQQLTLSGFA